MFTAAAPTLFCILLTERALWYMGKWAWPVWMIDILFAFWSTRDKLVQMTSHTWWWFWAIPTRYSLKFSCHYCSSTLCYFLGFTYVKTCAISWLVCRCWRLGFMQKWAFRWYATSRGIKIKKINMFNNGLKSVYPKVCIHINSLRCHFSGRPNWCRNR